MEAGIPKSTVWPSRLETLQSQSSSSSLDWQAKDSGELMVQMNSEGSMLDNSFLLWDSILFVLSESSTNCMKPTHIMGGWSALVIVHHLKC